MPPGKYLAAFKWSKFGVEKNADGFVLKVFDLPINGCSKFVDCERKYSRVKISLTGNKSTYEVVVINEIFQAIDHAAKFSSNKDRSNEMESFKFIVTIKIQGKEVV